jgi:hypothetical protein
MKTVRTPAGTELPLVNLKGKDYLMVAHRLQWFNEVETSFRIETAFLRLETDWAIAQAKITVFNKEGREVKSVMATKKETQKDFPDFMEKAETGAVGRALALSGYGTQFALSDLDEGSRLADAPVTNVKASKPTEVKAPLVLDAVEEVAPETPRKLPTFRKPKPETTTAVVQATGTEEWT